MDHLQPRMSKVSSLKQIIPVKPFTPVKQVASVTFLKVIPVERKNTICLCQSLRPMLTVVRFFGLFPVTWVHENKRCIYKKSLFWMFYTFLLTCGYITIFVMSFNLKKLFTTKCLIVILNDITNSLYGVYIVLLTIVAYFKFPKWIAALTQLSESLKDGIYCQPAIRTSILTQYANIGLLLTNIFIHVLILICLSLSSKYQVSYSPVDIAYRVLQDVTYGFQAQFTGFVIIMSGILACFEKLTKNTLHYTPLHPSKNLDDANTTTDFLGVVNYSLCKGSHSQQNKLSKSTPAEIIEYLRVLHEELSLCIYTFNDTMNPQFLLHTVVELVVLIIHWYAVVAYLVYTFKDPVAKAIHVTNCYYVLIHSSGLFLFLKNAQLLKNLVRKTIINII